TKIVKSVMDGTWKQDWDWAPPDWKDLNNLETSPVGFTVGDGLSEDNAKLLNQFLADMAAYAEKPENAKSMFLWEGPLNLQDGTVLAKEGEKVDLLDIWRLPQLLEGMTGASSTQS